MMIYESVEKFDQGLVNAKEKITLFSTSLNLDQSSAQIL